MADLTAAEIAITFEIVPLEVVDVNPSVAVGVACQFEYLALDARLVHVIPRACGLEEGGLVVLVLLALYGIARRDEPAQTEPLEVLREKSRKIAPLGVVAGQQHRLVAKRVRVVLQISVHLLLNVGILRIELIVLCRFRSAEVRVIGHTLCTLRECLSSEAGYLRHKKSMDDHHPHSEVVGITVNPDKSRPCKRTDVCDLFFGLNNF